MYWYFFYYYWSLIMKLKKQKKTNNCYLAVLQDRLSPENLQYTDWRVSPSFQCPAGSDVVWEGDGIQQHQKSPEDQMLCGCVWPVDHCLVCLSKRRKDYLKLILSGFNRHEVPTPQHVYLGSERWQTCWGNGIETAFCCSHISSWM